MTIKIGKHTIPTKKPANLDALLLAATGCGEAETAAQIRQGGYPSHVAVALHPFLTDKDAMSVGDLAGLIADADLHDVRQQVAKLYDTELAKPAEKVG